MRFTRRKMLFDTTAMVLASAGLPALVLAKDSPAVAALDGSQLIYLTPLLSDGQESQCHGEVWFVHYASEIFVVTQHDAWRAQAVRQGLTKAAIWIGEFGAWTRAKERYRSAPFLRISGAIENDKDIQSTVLQEFGEKYSAEWGSWGPRFSNGLADGSRIMLRYNIT